MLITKVTREVEDSKSVKDRERKSGIFLFCVLNAPSKQSAKEINFFSLFFKHSPGLQTISHMYMN